MGAGFQGGRGRLFLLALAVILLGSLALWSICLGLRLEDSRMQVKGMVLAGYALALAYLTFRIRAKPTTQAVLLASLVLALLGGEVITRIINPAPEDPDFRQAAPYIMFAGQPNGVIESFDDLPLNALGYRDLPALPKPPDEYRIILLGGSTVFQGVPRSESIAGALEGQFAANGQPQVKVYNWGVYSVVTGQELATILFRAVDYSPDMLLVYSGANDLTEPYFFDPRPGYPFDFMAVEAGQRLLEGRWGLYDLYAVLLRPTSLGFALFQFEIEEQLTQRHTLAQSVEWGGEDWRAELAQGYGQNLGKMCQLSRAFGFRLVAVLQPMIFFKDRLAGQESALLGPQDYQDHTSQAYSLAQAELTRLGQTYVASDCLFEDGSLWLQDDTRELFTDPVHLNALGNQRIGQRLAVLLGGVLE